MNLFIGVMGGVAARSQYGTLPAEKQRALCRQLCPADNGANSFSCTKTSRPEFLI